VPASTLGLIVDFMCFCVINHAYRLKYYAVRSGLIAKVRVWQRSLCWESINATPAMCSFAAQQFCYDGCSWLVCGLRLMWTEIGAPSIPQLIRVMCVPTTIAVGSQLKDDFLPC
jgi:hypothetical protein